ncbi:MAG: F420-nonreducing hydrogenase [Thermoplasmata archaeon]
MVVKVSTIQLGGCSGCHVSLLDVGKDLFSDAITVVHSYLLMDKVTDTVESDTDVLLIEGAVLTNEDEDLLRRIAPHAKTVLAVGSCACFGGIACLGNLKNPFVTNTDNLKDSKHKLHPLVCSPKAFIDVDYYIPGCPPPASVIGDTILALVNGKPVPEISHTVCDECEREKTHTAPPIVPGGKWKTTLDEAPDPKKCLLEQGYLCLGRQTMGGCNASCTKANIACEACRGPIFLFRGFKKFTDKEKKEVLKCLK